MDRAKKPAVNSIGAALQGKKVWLFVTEADVTAVTSAVKAARDGLTVAVNKTLDSIRVALDAKKVTIADALKGNAKAEPTGLRAELGRFAEACFTREAGYSRSTPRNYASSMVAALRENRAWEPDLANKLSAEKKAAKSGTKGKPSDKKSGPVSRTSWSSALKTAEKLVDQLGLLKANGQRRKSAKALRDWVASQDVAE